MIDRLLEEHFDYAHPLWHEFQHRNIVVDTTLIWEPGAGGNFIQSLYSNPVSKIFSGVTNEYKIIKESDDERFGWETIKPEFYIWLILDFRMHEELAERIDLKKLDASPSLRISSIKEILGIDRIYELTKHSFKHNPWNEAAVTTAGAHVLPHILDNICNFKTNNLIYISNNSTVAWIIEFLIDFKHNFRADLFLNPWKMDKLFNKIHDNYTPGKPRFGSEVFDSEDFKRKNRYFTADEITLFDNYMNWWFTANMPFDFIEPNSVIYFDLLFYIMKSSNSIDEFQHMEHLKHYFLMQFPQSSPRRHNWNNAYTQYCQEYFNDIVDNYVNISYEDLYFKLDLSKISFLNLDKDKIREYSLKNIKMLKAMCKYLEYNDKLYQLLDYENFLNKK